MLRRISRIGGAFSFVAKNNYALNVYLANSCSYCEYEMKIHNKTGKPHNILLKEQTYIDKINAVQEELPDFLRDYFLFLKTSVSVATRLAYLNDIKFFLQYLISDTPESNIKDLDIQIIENFTAKDFNYFIGEYCTRYEQIRDGKRVIFENSNTTLLRKKSAILSMLKFLYRNEQITHNIVDGTNPIKAPKKNPDAIKKLEVFEAEMLIHLVSTGEGLTKKEYDFWTHTKKRDLLIVLFFVIYGLRVSELEALNISSFIFQRNEYKIFRKRGKEVLMPLDDRLKTMLQDYIETERNSPHQKDPDALFLSTQGSRLSKRAIQNLIKKYTAIVMNTSKSNGYSPHKLRATAASSMIEKGFSIYDVQNILDHENVTTTQLYAAHKKNAKKEIIVKLDWLK